MKIDIINYDNLKSFCFVFVYSCMNVTTSIHWFNFFKLVPDLYGTLILYFIFDWFNHRRLVTSDAAVKTANLSGLQPSQQVKTIYLSYFTFYKPCMCFCFVKCPCDLVVRVAKLSLYWTFFVLVTYLWPSLVQHWTWRLEELWCLGTVSVADYNFFAEMQV